MMDQWNRSLRKVPFDSLENDEIIVEKKDESIRKKVI
jgi:hypothetical protein